MKLPIWKKAFFTIALIALCTTSFGKAYADPFPLEGFNELRPISGIEPESDGIVYAITFNLVRGPVSETCFALEGYGIGQEEWPSAPGRDDYIFAGWYDNIEREGSAYTMDTPIFSDTQLYVKWDYVGSGGCWPRDRRGSVSGIEEGEIISIEKAVQLTVDGYNMHLDSPRDQRFRWRPISWRVSGSANGTISTDQPFTFEITIPVEGDYELYITYEEEIYDGVSWQATDQTHEVVELSFKAAGDTLPVS